MYQRFPRFILPALLLLATLLSACGTTSTSAPSSAAGYSTIGVAELKQKLDSGASFTLLDVRTAEEYNGDGHIAGSVLIPVQELEQRLGELPKDGEIVCICRSGNRSRAACDLLAKRGFTPLTNIDGGMNAWNAAGYPIQ